MTKIEDSTLYGDMKPGDVFPDGSVIESITHSRNGDDAQTNATVVRVSRSDRANGKPVLYGAVFSSESYGESVARAQHLHSLADHS